MWNIILSHLPIFHDVKYDSDLPLTNISQCGMILSHLRPFQNVKYDSLPLTNIL